MEFHLKNQELHEFAQWFSFHYGGGIGGSEEQNKHPREDIIDLVDSFIKSKVPENGDNNVGFVKWFAEKYEIYGDCIGRTYQNFCEATNWDITMHKANTTQEWIDQHFGNEYLTDGLLYDYFQDKIKGDIFKISYLHDLKKRNGDRIKFIDEKGNPLDI